MLIVKLADEIETNITLAARGSVSLETICWSVRIAKDAARTGSLVSWGIAACPPFPLITAVNLPEPASKGPGLEPIVPVGSSGEICIPNMP